MQIIETTPRILLLRATSPHNFKSAASSLGATGGERKRKRGQHPSFASALGVRKEAIIETQHAH